MGEEGHQRRLLHCPLSASVSGVLRMSLWQDFDKTLFWGTIKGDLAAIVELPTGYLRNILAHARNNGYWHEGVDAVEAELQLREFNYLPNPFRASSAELTCQLARFAADRRTNSPAYKRIKSELQRRMDEDDLRRPYMNLAESLLESDVDALKIKALEQTHNEAVAKIAKLGETQA